MVGGEGCRQPDNEDEGGGGDTVVVRQIPLVQSPFNDVTTSWGTYVGAARLGADCCKLRFVVPLTER